MRFSQLYDITTNYLSGQDFIEIQNQYKMPDFKSVSNRLSYTQASEFPVAHIHESDESFEL